MRQGFLSHTYSKCVRNGTRCTPFPHGNASMCLSERTGIGSAVVPYPRKIGFSDEHLSQPLAKVPSEKRPMGIVQGLIAL